MCAPRAHHVHTTCIPRAHHVRCNASASAASAADPTAHGAFDAFGVCARVCRASARALLVPRRRGAAAAPDGAALGAPGGRAARSAARLPQCRRP
eukprot:440849-Prymnesium_polylepis.1